jgi:hypothetical protein
VRNIIYVIIFSDSVHGVKASANLYSLIESAKASGLEPYQYLRQVFTGLPQAETVEDIERLLPWALKKSLRKVRQAKPGREGNYVKDNVIEISWWDLADW